MSRLSAERILSTVSTRGAALLCGRGTKTSACGHSWRNARKDLLITGGRGVALPLGGDGTTAARKRVCGCALVARSAEETYSRDTHLASVCLFFFSFLWNKKKKTNKPNTSSHLSMPHAAGR